MLTITLASYLHLPTAGESGSPISAFIITLSPSGDSFSCPRMRTPISKFRTPTGASLVEMMIVITVMLVVSTFALMAIGDSQTHLDRENIAKDFKTSLERARFDSIRRNVSTCQDMARVVIESATVFKLLTDQNRDGVLTPEVETRTVDFTEPWEVAIVPGATQQFPITIRFDRRGNSSSGNCGAAVPAITPTVFCSRPCTFQSANEKNSNAVYVSPTGTTAYLVGGRSIPSLSPPTLDVLDLGNQINPGLAVWDMPTPLPSPTATPASGSPTPTSTGTPSPTATPEQSPTATITPVPTGSPSATPSSTASPTPTPTPRFCLLGEMPAIANCICSPLQYLQVSSGKCRAL